ncbi:MAG: C39 family peptidase [Candidatus Omnitrophica bacterium]|nr:C39 family peptidase [Candidatus Omnitrophota bacterium]
MGGLAKLKATDLMSFLNKQPANSKGWLFVSFFAIVLATLSGSLCTTSAAAVISVHIDSQRIQSPIKSVKDIRDRGVIKQAYDYSCGAAALATLLTYGLGDAISEQDILNDILKSLPKDAESLRKKQGLSLLDLQTVAYMRGHTAQGFRLLPESLPKLQRPVIVFIKPRGYEHFAVLKGVRDDRVYLADPSLGNVRMPIYKFLDMWLDHNGKGIIFVVERKDSQWTKDYSLKLEKNGLLQPEILTVRQMLEVGSPYVHYPILLR